MNPFTLRWDAKDALIKIYDIRVHPSERSWPLGKITCWLWIVVTNERVTLFKMSYLCLDLLYSPRKSIFTFLKLVFQAGWSSINFDLFLLGLDQLLTFGKFICLKYSSGRESSHMLLAPASTIIIRPEDTVLRMLCLEPLFPSRSKSLAFCLKHRAKWDFKIHLLDIKKCRNW